MYKIYTFFIDVKRLNSPKRCVRLMFYCGGADRKQPCSGWQRSFLQLPTGRALFKQETWDRGATGEGATHNNSDQRREAISSWRCWPEPPFHLSCVAGDKRLKWPRKLSGLFWYPGRSATPWFSATGESKHSNTPLNSRESVWKCGTAAGVDGSAAPKHSNFRFLLYFTFMFSF